MKKPVIFYMLLLFTFLSPSVSQVYSQAITDYKLNPPFLTQGVPPLVMAVMGRDHKLYYEAYNDAFDLDGDGLLDVGYKHSIDYYGYFDSYKCYTFSSTGTDRFVPASTTNDKYCGSGWSGNFMNWLTMSRMDVLRKVLYGGYRSRDDSSVTYLEGVYIPQDAHSWGKEYSGTDTDQLTPFSDPTSGNRHLFCVTSLSDGAAPVIRVLTNNSNRAWDWASKERPVCDTSLGTPADYEVRVEVCKSGLRETNCKEYPNGSNPYKPIGLFQKYGEAALEDDGGGNGGKKETKVCTKSFEGCNNDNDCSLPNEKCKAKAKMFFGLMTGSYTKNLSGGVLRWNIDEISHGVDNTNVGKIFDKGILKTLNNLRITGFDYSNYSYGPWQWGGAQNCGWLTTRGLQEGECRVWGNPIAEMMYETERYFAGKAAPTGVYSSGTDANGTDDKNLGLPNQSSAWETPYDQYPACAKPFMLVMSDVNPSYDSDQLPGSSFGSFTGDLANLDVSTLADTIGLAENINGTNAFIGQNSSTFDTLCSSKSVSLGSIRGLCPEEPTKEGSYYSAAVAYYGKTLFSANNGDIPDITTYSIAFASPVPEINIDVNGKNVTVIPIGKSVSGCVSVNSACANECTLTYDATKGIVISNCSSDAYCPSNQIVDFYVSTIGTNTGTFRINFEDVEQGADHDMDAIVEYQYTVSGNQVTITLDSSVYASGCIDQALGFIISGTTEDGVYLPVKDDDVANSADGDTPSVVATMPETWSKVFNASATGSSTSLLKNPLWYAAKWGGFDDINGNNQPDLTSEWDKDNDGVPDTYFFVSNPLELEKQLTKVFDSMLDRATSGTAVSVLSTSGKGEGAVYQAYFLPSKVENDREVNWLGYLNALWIDKGGYLHEETTTANELNFTGDKVIQFRYDTGQSETVIDRYDYNDNDNDGTIDSGSLTLIETINVGDLSPIWEAGEKLAIKTAASRKIYTFIDKDENMICDSSDGPSCSIGTYGTSNISSGGLLTFETGNKTVLRPFLHAADDSEAEKIIRFIRGEDVSGYRDRTVSINGVDYEWKLGDIVSSTPVAVNDPPDRYEVKYGDSSYVSFYEKYKDRDTIVYAGANDGTLHAFYAGKFKDADSQNSAAVQGSFEVTGSFSSLSVGLGDELWAYVPYDLLPHLKWLTDPKYSHVFYVDMDMQIVDVQIFTPGTEHPGGWGTILIGAMKFGGGEMTFSDTFDGSTTTSRTFTSSYFILDVTDPTKPPALLGRFTDPNLGFTTSYPAVAKVANEWFLVIGSGPKSAYPPTDDPSAYNGLSNQTARIFVLNLKKMAAGNSSFLERTFDSSDGLTDDEAFMADIITVDADGEFIQGGSSTYETEVIYAGMTYWDDAPGNNDSWKSKMLRIPLKGNTDPDNWGTPSVLYATAAGQAITVSANAAKDHDKNLWIYFGTGRYFGATQDGKTTDQQGHYGIIDPCWEKITVNTYDDTCTDTVSESEMFDSKDVIVKDDGTVTGVSGVTGWTDGSTFDTFITKIGDDYKNDNLRGWYLKFPATTPSAERSLTECAVAGGITAFTTFTPGDDLCSIGGTGTLYSLFYTTGTAFKGSTIGCEDLSGNTAACTSSGTNIISKSISLGQGVPSRASVHFGTQTGSAGSGAYGGTGGTIFIQDNAANIKSISFTTAIGIKSGNLSWQEK